MVRVAFLFIYFVVGYLLLSISRVYKYLYKIEDKNTKTDLLISYFIISMYMTILIIFPEQFGENYKIGLIGVGISYLTNGSNYFNNKYTMYYNIFIFSNVL